VLGVLYWDPVMIATPGIGWAVRDADGVAGPNVVANTTLFDFDGRALPVLDGWQAQMQQMQQK
jgi:arabinogalactan endo-1,4-beta-galactosidase